MSKYNNSYYGSPGSSESLMRFNKRPRYGVNNSPRFSQPNQTSYNYQQNRHNSSPSSGSYQNAQYERSPRNYYDRGSTKRPLQHKQQQSSFERQNNQSSPPFLNVSRTISTSSPSPTAAAAAAITNRKSVPPVQPTTPQSANTVQSNQQQHSSTVVPGNIPEQPFAYNNYFYPNYNTDSIESPTASSYGMNYNISQYMWQTITSTPPPNLLHQPPLPQQPPPTQLPPLPGADVSSQLQPPPAPQSSLLSILSSVTTDYRDKSNDSRNFAVSKPVVKMKVKRKAMSSRYTISKNWSQQDAELALKAEEDITINQHKDNILILRFPDPEINRDVIKNYNPAIESVHFQLNFAPRYCFVHLKPEADVQQTIETLSKVPFGNGFLKAEVKNINAKPRNTKPCDIDPCTLYVGNLPTTIACTVLKEHFPGASRIDIGFAQRMKYTRYAFIRYPNVQLSIEAYKRMSDAEIGGRSLLLRFRRTGTQRDDHKDETENTEDLPGDEDSIDDFSLQSSSLVSSLAEKGNSIEVSQKQTDISDTQAQTSNVSNEITDINTDLEKQGIRNNENNSERNQEPTNENNQQNETESNENNSNNRTKHQEVGTNLSVPLVVQNIKPDPDIDPDDKVVEDETITSRFDYYDQRVKQEKQMATDLEFFAPAEDQLNGSAKNTTVNEVISLSTTTTTTTDDCDDTNDTGASLSEFLRTCQREESVIDTADKVGAPAMKRAKTLLEKEIKHEPIEEEINTDLISTAQQEQSSVATTTIKQEFNTINENLNNKSVEDISDVDILPEDNFLQSIIMDKTKATSTKGNSKTINRQKIQTPKTSKDVVASPETSMLEKLTHLNNNTHEERQAIHNPKFVTLSNSGTSNLQKDNDDLVPNSALFLRSDNENSANEMYDDEFFATKSKRISQNTITPLAETIKQELVEKSTDLQSQANTTAYHNNTNTSYRQPEQLTNRQTHELLPKTKPNETIKSPVNFSNVLNKHPICLDEDDLVPENNCLLSRQLSSHMDCNLTATVPTPEIKLEKDLEDLFSTPCKKTYHECLSENNTNSDGQLDTSNNSKANYFKNVCGDNINLNVNNKENSSDNSATDTLKAKSSTQNTQVSNNGSNEFDELSDDDDDDLIIISENFPPISKPTVTTSSAESNFLGQSELLTFKRILTTTTTTTTTDHNVNSIYATIHESSRKLQHHDNLDKLFQQLDSDSDGEL